MRRLSLFIPSSNDQGHIQIVAKECDQSELEALGFVDHIDKLSQKTHEQMILEMTDKRFIESYVLELTGVNIDLRGKLGAVHKKAIGAVESWKQQEQ